MEKEESKTQQSKANDAMQNKYMWVIGGILLLIAGWFGWNMLFGAGGTYSVSLVDAPKEISGATATFTWRVDGPATTIKNTEVYFGTVSSPGELGKDVKPADTKYTDFVKDFSNGEYGIPLQFVGNSSGLTTPGTYYFRVHATIKDKHYWSDEYTIEVTKLEPKVTLLTWPKEVVVNTQATFTWRVDGPATTIPHTSIHFSRESVPGELGLDVKPADTKYTDLVKDFADGSYTIPLQFVGNIILTRTGTNYFRAHAIIDGKHYWTQEYTLEVVKAGAVATVAPTQ